MSTVSNLMRRVSGQVGLACGAALSGCVVAPPPVVHVPAPVPYAAPASALPPMYFYPERAQGAAQQDRDRYECYRWAVGQSGFDPGMTPVSMPGQAVPPPVRRDGADVAAGAVVGAVASSGHHSASGAVIGAIFGAALGAIAQESRAQAAEHAQATIEQRNQAARQAAMARLDGFRRAMSACMAGRGYRVG